MGFTVVFLVKGAFVKDPNLNYKGGEIHAFKNIDEDTWSYFEAIGLIQELDPTVEAANVKLWWKPSNGSLEDDLKALTMDKDAIDLCNYAVSKNTEVDIYVEYKGTEVSECSDDEDTNSSDGDSVRGIHFDDSEEERVGELDDGFDEAPTDVVVEVPTKEIVDVPVEELSKGKKKNVGRKVKQTSNSKKTETFEGQIDGVEDLANTFVNPADDAMHTIDDEYLTDELDSASDTSSEADPRPKTERFNPDYMSKDFKFSIGMEFSSLKQFKDAIMEHNVLIGREVKYAKNDSVRVRVVCKFKEICQYTVLVSREGRTTTYRIKTLRDKHTCGRVFANKSAKTNWVAKEMVDKLKNNHKVKINEVMAYIRTQFSTEITFSRAFKARQIARKIVEGDSSKQYALLWSYSAELKRASPGNTCKLHLERPSPNLQPRFGRYYICFDGCKKALKNACRPFIGVDGCHLKNKYGGQLLIAVGRDPNDQYLPLAFAVVETETKDTWRWFLNLLLEDIGDATTNRWTFISDQQKGLIATFEELLGGSEHRFCLRHLYANFKKKFGGGTMMRDLMMAAAKATYFEAWEDKMMQLKELDAKAYEWLVAVPTNQWCKHAVAAIHRKQDDPAKYVHRYYNRETYINCYDQLITPINGQNKWPKTDYPEVLPPQYKQGPGRPKKLRRRELDEPKNNSKWKRTHTTHRCKRCLQYGHNARTCKNPQVDNLDAQTETNLDGEQPATQDLQTQASQSAAAPKKRGRPKGKNQVTAKPNEQCKKKPRNEAVALTEVQSHEGDADPVKNAGAEKS